MAIRDEILSRKNREPVKVNAWNKDLYIRRMTNVERDSYEFSIAGDKKTNFRAKLLVKCLYDPDGERVFTDEDATALGEQDFDDDISKLFTHAWEMNELTAKSVEDAAKNSSSDPNA